MIARFQATGVSAGMREVVVAVEDPDDDPGDAEQRDDREEDPREADGERASPPGSPKGAITSGASRMKIAVSAVEAEQHQPEEARGDAPGALALALLEQLAEDGHERRRERGVRDERADEVRDLERDRERVDLPGGAEVVGGDDLAHEAEDAGEACGEREDRASRPGEPPGRWGRPAPRRSALSPGPVSLTGPTLRGGAVRKTAALLPSSARWRGRFHAMPNIKQQKKRVRTAADERLENLRYRSTIKTLTKRLAAAVEDGDAGRDRSRAPRRSCS